MIQFILSALAFIILLYSLRKEWQKAARWYRAIRQWRRQFFD